MDKSWKGLGFEIWRVPKDWKHPIDRFGNPVRLYDQDFDTAVQKWRKGYAEWYFDHITYWVAVGMPPIQSDYLPFQVKGLNCYQLYDDQGLGIPVSPVFETLDEVRTWLVTEKYNRTFVRAFTKIGFNRPSENADEKGYFILRRVEFFEGGLAIYFIVNGYFGLANISNDPLFTGLNGTLIQDMSIYRPKDKLSYGDTIYFYPNSEIGEEKHPDFLDNLVILLDHLANVNFQQPLELEEKR